MSEMDSTTESYLEAVEATDRRLTLIVDAIHEVRQSVLDPMSADMRADLLLKAEELGLEANALLDEVRCVVWPRAMGR